MRERGAKRTADSMTRVQITDDFSLDKIADCGQCFRAKKLDDGSFRFICGEDVLLIREAARNRFEVSSTGEEWETVWSRYFDLPRNYSRIRDICENEFAEEDSGTAELLHAAAEAGSGLRILRQDPWEMLVTFIISQRKNMPAIALAVEKLSDLYGHMLPEGLHTFPTPDELIRADESDLRAAGLGYRAPYIRDATEKVLSGALDLEAMKGLDDEELFEKLMTVKGVGKKVANCVCLFGYGRTGRSPVDVWIERAIEKCGGMDPFPRFGEYAGIMQQYVFYYMTHLKSYSSQVSHNRVISSTQKSVIL